MILKSQKKLKRDQFYSIEGSESPPNHVITSYEKYISKSIAEHIVFVSHSAGGWSTCELLKSKYGKDVMKRTRAIGFTDSVHDVETTDKKVFLDFLMNNSINWVTSKKKLDTFIKVSENQSCKCLSAGHDVHENTSSSCQVSLFKFLDQKIKIAKGEETEKKNE